MLIDEKLEVIEPLMNFQKIKYSKLNEIIPVNFIRGKFMNVYINLNSILESMYTENMLSLMNSLDGNEYLIMVPEFINIMAHYRHYFWSRFGSRSRFFIYYLNKPTRLSKHLNKDYCKKYISRLDIDEVKSGVFNDIMKTIIRMIDRIILYIPGCYLIESNGIEHSLIPYYIMKRLNKKDNQSNIVLTHDYYDFQLLNLKNSIIVSPSGNRSRGYFKKDIYEKKRKGSKYNLENDISPELFSLLMSCSGYGERNISKIINFAKVIKSLDELISIGKIENKYTSDIKSIISNIDENKVDDVYNNFLLCDLKNQEKTINKKDESMIRNKLMDLRDNTTLMNLNSEYFKFNNIQTIELEEGEW